jgi:hypothetical protein
MTVLRLAAFEGMVPILEDHLLPDNAAAEAVNMRSDAGGTLRGIGTGRVLANVNSSTRHVFRLPTASDVTDISSGFWMQFTDPNTDVLRGPTVNDGYERYYWCSPSTGLKYAPKANIINNLTSFEVGVVPDSTSVMRIEWLPGTGQLDPTTNQNVARTVTRAYVVTFINAYGEESQPGRPAEGTGPSDADWLISMIPQAPIQGNHAAVVKKRLYRTVTGASGSTTFFKVTDLQPAESVYVDRLSDSVVSGQGSIGSVFNALPPPMDGIAMMPNGIMVGFKNNNLYFSENFKPWSWPAEYTLTVEHAIVGLGVFGNTCVVCTTGRPAAVSGTRADSLSLQSHNVSLPCLARKSIVSTINGVVWASDNGLVMFGPQGFTMLADNIGREKWQTDYTPRAIRAFPWGTDYAFWLTGTDGYAITPGMPAGVRKIRAPAAVTGAGFDILSGRPWYLAGTTIQELAPNNAAPLDYSWRSKLFQVEHPQNFSALQLMFARDADPAHSVTVTVTCLGNDGAETLVFLAEFTPADHRRIIRLPGGFLSDTWRFEVAGKAALRSVFVATSVDELRAV